ncbi:UNVERIFIED_CONTAM: hypothetical protein FKN15_068806 [Acipenser sinensis]
MQGSTQCTCDEGFQITGRDNSLCQDLDECELYYSGRLPRLCAHACVNCTCDEGFQIAGRDNSLCQDLDECELYYSGRLPRLCAHACVNTPGSYRCTCPPGYSLRGDQRNCKDLDECELYYSGRLPRLCAHACVNTPGSYRCTCPPGYSLRGDQRNCKDVDECASRQHNCSRDELCVNTFGGFQCMQPDCPRARQNTSYVKTSLLRCERNPCPVDNKACAQAASSISFSYLSLVSNLSVPRVLFRMSAARMHGDSLRFGLLGGRGRGHFSLQRSDRRTGELVLVSRVLGPAVLEAELEMTELEKKTVLARFISKVTVFISQRCERNPCPVDNKACTQAASSISFSYLSLVSNLSVPRVLFRMSAARMHGDSLRFGLLGGRGRGHFSLQRSDRRTGELVLVSRVLGPAVLEAELEMTELEKKTVLARFISKVTVFISQYDF